MSAGLFLPYGAAMNNPWDRMRLVLERHPAAVVPIPLWFHVTTTDGKRLGIISISDLRKAVAEFDEMASPFQPTVAPLRVSVVGDHLEVTAVLTDSDAVDSLISILTNNKHFVPLGSSHET